MMVRFRGDVSVILWIAAVGAFVLFIGDLALKVWVIARAWF